MLFLFLVLCLCAKLDKFLFFVLGLANVYCRYTCVLEEPRSVLKKCTGGVQVCTEKKCTGWAQVCTEKKCTEGVQVCTEKVCWRSPGLYWKKKVYWRSPVLYYKSGSVHYKWLVNGVLHHIRDYYHIAQQKRFAKGAWALGLEGLFNWDFVLLRK